MAKNNLIPPYMKDKHDKIGLFEKYGFLKCVPCFLVTLTECAVIAGIIYGILWLIKNEETTYIGLSIIAVLCFFVLVGWSLIAWNKRKNKQNDSIEKEV